MATLKRVLLAVLVLAILAAGGLFAWSKLTEEHEEVRGSTTVEFVPTQVPGKKRPKQAVIARPWPTYGYDVARTRNASQFKLEPPFRKLWTVRSGNLLEYPPVVANGRAGG